MIRGAFFMLVSLIFSSYIQAQTFTISGVVKDSNSAPVVGATIQLVGRNIGVSTNQEGKFTISNLPPGKFKLKASFIGLSSVEKQLELTKDQQIEFEMNPKVQTIGEGFAVIATRATDQTPMTFQNISAEEIEDINLGQDLPILLNQTVSAVTTSDAGAGVGYTGIRIRGSDATRINVTVNGVPINDPESHGIFWVNMPDLTSSTSNIQIQRGVGTSSNGAASFGASINMNTMSFEKEGFVELNNSFGSFNTRKHNLIFNSGLISKNFNVEGRLSYIESDGYIDRSAANLRSYYLAGGYLGEKLTVKAITFSGKEITQQAWWGTPESRVNGDEEAMLVHAANNGLSERQTKNLLESGRTYNYYEYENEVDNYQQDHYQLIGEYALSKHLKLNLTGHYTYGRGYFEQFKEGESFEDLGFDPKIVGSDTVFESDVVLQRWLDNHFYGGVYSLQYDKGALSITLGGSYNEYLGDHFGEVIWSEFAPSRDVNEQYYFSDSKKTDFSNYLKAVYNWKKFTFYADMQLRTVDYRTKGIDNDQRSIDVDANFTFFNPKGGLMYKPNANNLFYASIAQASREPVRSDFIDAIDGQIPASEFLTNAELGWTFKTNKWNITTNLFYMDYQNQLVLTGELNDVGSSVRANVDESYRAGIEIIAEVKPYRGLFWRPNATFSQNKIATFDEIVYDYTVDFDVVTINHQNTDIAFSPNVIVGSQLGYETKFGLTVALLSKYVGKQFLDNTSNDQRAIQAYFVNDVLLSYDVPCQKLKRLTFNLLLNNVLSEEYSSNGYTYSYIAGDQITENFYYPQAGFNWLLGAKVRF